MDITNEINKLQEQINILKKKQEENERFNNDESFAIGDMWVFNHNKKLIVKTFYIHDSHLKDMQFGFVFTDGSARLFDSKYNMYKFLSRDFTYLGKDKNKQVE